MGHAPSVPQCFTEQCNSLLLQVVVGGEGGCDAIADSCAELAGGVGASVAAGVDAGDAGAHVDVSVDVAEGIHFQQALEVLGVGMEANVNEGGGGVVVVDLFGL